MSTQVPIVRVTAAAIVGTPEFALGLEDMRKGVPFDWRIGGSGKAAWDYERGRQFGCIAPLSMPLRIGRKLNPKAIALYHAASNRGLIV
jgi:hypothetical protein